MAPKLEVELVPSTAWWSNVRTNVSRKNWEKIKKLVQTRSGNRCEICGGSGLEQGRKHAVEAHETWDYDDDKLIQTLVGLIALCPLCHSVKHIGRTFRLGDPDRALRHLAKVNGWDMQKTEWYVSNAYQLWELRSTTEWGLDISLLSLLGIEPITSGRNAAEENGAFAAHQRLNTVVPTPSQHLAKQIVPPSKALQQAARQATEALQRSGAWLRR